MKKLSHTITDIEGIRVGHAESKRGITGVTVIRFPKEGAIASYVCRGGAPGTRETDLLEPGKLVERIHALVLSGGSAYGLDSAHGVMKRLEAEGIGYKKLNIVIPIVPAAVIYDLNIGNSKIRPNSRMGYEACKKASSRVVRQGNSGAGLGATVGKLKGMEYAMKGGLGSHSIRLPGGIVVAGLFVVNSLGDVYNPKTGRTFAGTRSATQGKFVNTNRAYAEFKQKVAMSTNNTIVGVVATNARFNKSQLKKLAGNSFKGLSKTIKPFCTMFDGDTIFSVSLPSKKIKAKPSMDMVSKAMIETVIKSTLNAVRNAKSVDGIPSINSFRR